MQTFSELSRRVVEGFPELLAKDPVSNCNLAGHPHNIVRFLFRFSDDVKSYAGPPPTLEEAELLVRDCFRSVFFSGYAPLQDSLLIESIADDLCGLFKRKNEVARESKAGLTFTDRHLVRANNKMSDPKKYPDMTAKEAMAALQLGKSAIYEHPGLARVPTGTRAVRFTTQSVIDIKNSPPE